jgi:hypothetical protein
MNRVLIATAIALPLMLTLCASVASGEKTFAFCVNGPETGFLESELESKLYHNIIAHPQVDLVNPDTRDSVLKKHPEFAVAYFDPDMMRQLAGFLGSRYVVWIAVEESDIRQSSRTWIPYVFKSYHRKCVLGVRLYVIDSYSGETIVARYYEEDKPGPSVLSHLDFDPNDAGLMESYSEVELKFRELEDDISEKITEELIELAESR